ncbi:MAG: hypothetical protein K5989_02765 [Lachnospiraceae bacterium]|nr:hypothetical protein [Lachnospiraceae bacterium]
MNGYDPGKVNMTYSGILHDKNGKAFVCIRFERRNRKGGMDEAEMRIPSGKVMSNKGFSPDEIRQMSAFLKENEDDIKGKAKSISSFLHIFR